MACYGLMQDLQCHNMNDKLTDNQINSGLSLYYNLPKEPDAEQAVPVLFGIPVSDSFIDLLYWKIFVK